MDQNPKFDSLLEALDAIDSGVKVDQCHLRDLVKDVQGDHECAVSFGPEDGFEDVHCDKNPGHTKFIPTKDFKLEDLPPQYQTKENFESIKQWSDITVKIHVKYISLERPAMFPDGITPYPFYKVRGSRRVRRFGTGYFKAVFPMSPADKGKACPCLLCRSSDNPETEFWFVQVFTATHVIYDDTEANVAVVECFYDSDEDLASVKKIYGVYMENTAEREYEDVCELLCATHDRELVERLKKLSETHKVCIMPHYRNDLGVLISHPHGKSKTVTVGNVLHLTIPICPEFPTQTPIKFGENTECRLPPLPWCQNEQLSEAFDTEPGKEFILPEGLRYILPENATFARRLFNVATSWFVFPSGTMFMLGTNVMFLPAVAEFRNDILFENSLSYLTYDIASCPGSSGAGLLQDGGRSLYSTFPHSGSLAVYAKSGLRCYSVYTSSPFKPFDDDDDEEFETQTQTSGCLVNVLNRIFPCFDRI